MATPSQSQAVKSLNTSAGRKRFVFKNFSQRVEEIDIGETVFRSLDTVKAEPSSGSSFFRDCLLEWRELNTAEDFISFYEEMMPWVQTLPQVILHKETIMSKLLSRLQVTARLSLEPILRLIAALSRDLLKDFLPFLKRITDALVRLLKNGAEREPEVLEQIFTSWSYIMMYLKKYLREDIAELLKITRQLRYYPKDYVEEFMAESVSYLLRNAPDKQRMKGIRDIIHEVVKKPSHIRKSGASALLWHIMKGTPSKFHSKAEDVLRLLMSSCIINIGGSQGSVAVVEVVAATIQRVCEELHPKEFILMWDCLFDEVSSSSGDGNLLHLCHVMSLLISSIQFSNGGKVSDYKPMLDLVKSLIDKYIRPCHETVEDHFHEVVNKVLQLMLCLLDGLLSCNDLSTITVISLEWSPLFELRNGSLLHFVRELIQKDPSVSVAFRSQILSAMNHLVEVSPAEEIIYLLLTFFDKFQATSSFSDGMSEEMFPRVCNFLQESISVAINDIAHWDSSTMQFNESKLAALWGILNCYPHISNSKANPSLILDLVDALDKLPMIEADEVAGVPTCTWQSLVGAALACYHRLQLSEKSALTQKTKTFLDLAKKYRSSSQVLFAVAEFLDAVQGYPCEADAAHKTVHPELEAENAIQAMNVFADNLSVPGDMIRISTLRILCNYKPLNGRVSENDQPARKKLKTEASLLCKEDTDCNNVIQLLLAIETTPLSISTSRKVVLLIYQIQMALSAGRISEDYVPLLLNGIIGIFHKRFHPLWGPAQECLTVLIHKYGGNVWDRLIGYLGQCQLQFLTSANQLEGVNAESSNKSSDLVDCFKAFLCPSSDGTPCTTVLSLLLQSLQKVPSIAESKSRSLIPLFLKFLGYTDDSARDCNVGSFVIHTCKGKEWRGVLKEWLNLLKLMRNPRSLYLSQFLKEVLIMRLLDETDADIQLKVLDCLLNWRDDFLLPYDQHLRNLITSKNLREELATWTLSKESHHIEDLHRGNLIPMVIRLLIPKVRNLKTLASRMHASVHHRRAILCFLAQVEISELPLFFVLLIKPLLSSSNGNEGPSKWFWGSCEISLEEFQACNIVKYFTADKLMGVSWKKRYGFLHVFEDILKSFDEFRLRPFLNLFMGLVVRILESCTVSLDECKGDESSQVANLSNEDLALHNKAVGESPMATVATKPLKEQRSLCLKIISLVLNKYDDHDFGCSFWEIFFTSVKASIDSFRQEGASSERPSSLFSCFLAMSRSHTLVSLLQREESLVSTIFSLLTVKTASSAITVSVLAFIENLLNLDSDGDSQQSLAIKGVLLPNLGSLINSLHSFFQCYCDSQRKSVKWPGKTELRIFKLLSTYINEPLAAMKFVDILLPFLSKKARNSDECLEVLHVIEGIVLKLRTTAATGKILNAVASLLIFSGLDVRLCICDLLDGLAVIDPSVASLAKLVRELNAISISEIDELDYDTRVSAYEKVNQEYFYTTKEDHAIVILSHSVYDMSSEELILRQSAYRLFLSFVNFSAFILDSEAKDKQGMSGVMVAIESDSCWTKAFIQRIIKKFFLKHMGEAMIKGISIQREWIALLRDMVLRLHQIPMLNSVKELCSKDAEVDFFNNILHLQIHRRAKALARFQKKIVGGNFSETVTKKVFVPLFFKMLFDVQDGQREHLRNACLESLAAISGHMKWEAYHAFLLRCFREMTFKPDKQKVLLRLICHVLDQFHFTETFINQEAEGIVCETMEPGVIGLSSLTTLSGNSCGFSSEIQTRLQNTVLPKIQKLLNTDSDRVNVTINLAALKLLKRLPLDTMESQLPNIIHRVCNFLKNRLESIRDEARNALAACSKELGLEYLQFIVKVLRGTLKRGYEMHVLGYTLNFILLKALPSPSIGKLDYCLEELLSVAENDILGDVAEEKEVEKIASKMKETKKPKSFETLKLVAQNITFKTHALKLLSPVKAHLHKHLTPKLKAKLEKMLHHIAEGIGCNPSVDNTDLFVFVYGLIEDGIVEENLQGRSLSISKSNKKMSDGIKDKRNSCPWIVDYKAQSSHLITVFALRVLHNQLKSIKLDKKDEQLLSMLDPFVKLLGDCLSSKFEDILSAALRCVGTLIRLPLPSLEIQADNIKTALLEIARKSGNTSSPLLQSGLSLLTVLLRNTNITLSSDQLHMLIQFPLFVDLERNPSFVALLLLKAIVRRKLVVPEIYDVVTQVAKLMVTSQVEPIRKKCSQILLRFLLEYPRKDNLLQEHLNLLLSNLSYEYSTGREAVLEMLHAIIIKFPKHIVDEHAQTFFVKLVVCLANDQDSKVRSMIGAALKLLIGRTSQSTLNSILEYSLSWYAGANENLWSPAAQVLGLLVEVLKKGFRSHLHNAFPVMKGILNSALGINKSEQPKCSNEATIPFWREAYYTLVLLEKLLLHFPELYFEKDIEVIWDGICEYLLYPHMWIRNISCRLLASYFAAVSEASRADNEKLKLGTFLLMKPSRLFAIAVCLCCQLKAQLTDDAVNMLITQNLIFAICGVHSLVGQRKCMGLHEFWSALEVSEQGRFVKAFQLLGSKKGSIMLATLSGESVVNAEDSVADLQSLLVSPLLKRLGKVALQMEASQMKIVFKCFQTISSQIGQEGCQRYAIDILFPLYKVCEGFTGKVVADDAKQLAEEVRESIRGIIGVENFVKVYNEIRKILKAKRDKRKHQDKLMAAVNPKRNAKRKLRIAAKHRAHKKRKIMSMKKGRWNT
ncbi:Small subunit processome component 20-like protein [Thalictrum thalictroides]|uniref:Small subunit processome component 20-like protein n=1 Tax=Thalictrum thalictroides TaxID=46969 RepID=A0A7J6WQG3_THATH|nr:Small subunit processome component 20-like protein [Thalictrum thalictroides]